MRNMKRFYAIFLACVLSLAIAVPALAANASGYTDVDAGAWYAEAVEYCREHGLMQGTSDAAFAPDSELTRAV